MRPKSRIERNRFRIMPSGLSSIDQLVRFGFDLAAQAREFVILSEFVCGSFFHFISFR